MCVKQENGKAAYMFFSYASPFQPHFLRTTSLRNRTLFNFNIIIEILIYENKYIVTVVKQLYVCIYVYTHRYTYIYAYM